MRGQMGQHQPQPPLCVVSGGRRRKRAPPLPAPVPSRVREKVHLGPGCLVRTGDRWLPRVSGMCRDIAWKGHGGPSVGVAWLALSRQS